LAMMSLGSVVVMFGFLPAYWNERAATEDYYRRQDARLAKKDFV